MPYPCQCGGCLSCSEPPGSCPTGNCLFVPSVILNTPIGPCGDSFTLDMSALETTDLSACTGSITWSIVSFGAGLTGVEIDSDGVLSGGSIDADTSIPGVRYTVTGLAKCSNSSLSIYFTVKVLIENKCSLVLPPEGFYCSPCSGEILPNAPDLILS